MEVEVVLILVVFHQEVPVVVVPVEYLMMELVDQLILVEVLVEVVITLQQDQLVEVV